MNELNYNLEQIEELLLAVERGELSTHRARARLVKQGLTRNLPAHIVNEVVRELTHKGE